MDISNDRWTCPLCDRTLVFRTSLETPRSLAAVQERHALSEHSGSRASARHGGRALGTHPFPSAGERPGLRASPRFA